MTDADKYSKDMDNAVAKAIFLADYPKDNWERFKEGDLVQVRYLLMARAALDALCAFVDIDKEEFIKG